MPYETWIVPKQHNCDFVAITGPEYTGLAEALKHALEQTRRLLNDPPLNYLIHTAPFRRPRVGYWTSIQYDYHWHLEILPRLTRPAGFEEGSGFSSTRARRGAAATLRGDPMPDDAQVTAETKEGAKAAAE